MQVFGKRNNPWETTLQNQPGEEKTETRTLCVRPMPMIWTGAMVKKQKEEKENLGVDLAREWSMQEQWRTDSDDRWSILLLQFPVKPVSRHPKGERRRDVCLFDQGEGFFVCCVGGNGAWCFTWNTLEA
jgi:hypothetical protein